MDEEAPITELLKRWRKGDDGALEKIMPEVYGELRHIARAALARESRQITVQPTSLVNEAYLRLSAGQRQAFNDRRHFVAVTARIMRQVLVDHARRRNAAKRDGGVGVTLSGVADPAADVSLDLIAVNDALDALGEIQPRHARIVELRFFGGLTNDEAADALGVSVPTVKRGWRVGRAWLADALGQAI